MIKKKLLEAGVRNLKDGEYTHRPDIFLFLSLHAG